MGVFLFVLCFSLILSACSLRDVLSWTAVGILVITGLIYPKILGYLIVYGIPALMAYAVIVSLCAVLWRHIKGSSGSVPPPTLRLQPKAPPRRLPRDLLLKSER